MKPRKTKKSSNKKVINAIESKLDGIEFRSKLERSFYKRMILAGLSPEYETVTAVLFEGFRPSRKCYINGNPVVTKTGKNVKLIDWHYTPDFVVRLGCCTFYIEAKGHPNDLWPYKRKMFLKWLESQDNSYFFEVYTVGGMLKSIETMKQIADGTTIQETAV